MFDIKLKGYKPNEKIRIQSISGFEIFSLDLEVTKEGTFIMNMLPAVVGMKGGTCTFSVVGEENIPVQVEFAWGKDAKAFRLKKGEEIPKFTYGT